MFGVALVASKPVSSSYPPPDTGIGSGFRSSYRLYLDFVRNRDSMNFPSPLGSNRLTENNYFYYGFYF